MPSTQPIADSGEQPLHINTRFGRQAIDPASVIRFPVGLAGFEDLREYKLFHEEGQNSLFYLQSLTDPEVRFPLIDPLHSQVAYEFVLSDEEAGLLELDAPDDVAVLVTLARTEDDDHGLHANFMGPILINTRRRVAIQKSLNKITGRVVIRSE